MMESSEGDDIFMFSPYFFIHEDLDFLTVTTVGGQSTV